MCVTCASIHFGFFFTILVFQYFIHTACMSISKGFICTNFWSSSSLVWEKAYLCLFVYKISQVQILSLSLIINQTKLKYKNVFMNKLMNIRTIRTYVFHMLGSQSLFYVIGYPLTKRTLFVIGQFQDIFNTSRNKVSRSSVEVIKSVQENKLKVQIH